MRILLLSAYHAQSHRSWCASLMAMFPEYQWTLLSLPGRYFNWRVRGNALSWSLTQTKILNQQYDLVVATSMVDCATLRGLVPSLAVIPWRIYFHENQFVYPVIPEHDHTEPKMVSLYNALCADKILFNSQYNYKTFMSGLDLFLQKMPDEVPLDTLTLIESKCVVVPVPVNIPQKKSTRINKVPVLLWNHRWEYDKGPQQLLNVLLALKQRDYHFKLNLIGQQFRVLPDALVNIKKIFSNEIINYGYIDSFEQYQSVLNSSDLVLSTALHDFQGLAVLEAVALGCIPIVPNRLAYSEIFPEQYYYNSNLAHPEKEVMAMVDKITELSARLSTMDLADINILKFSLKKLKPLYSKVLFSA